MIKVALNPVEGGARYLMVSEPSGREELAFAGGSGTALTDALARLLGAPHASNVPELSLSNRDRILAALYVACFGDQVESVLRCSGCVKPYEFGFSMGELVTELTPRVDQALTPDVTGVFTLAPGVRFRLPTVEDERMASACDDESAARLVLERCVVEGDVERNVEALDQAMQRLAPLLRSALDAACPHCGTKQIVDFDIVTYFARCFARERPLLTREIHCLASAYRFSYVEILEMPRSMRQELVGLVLGQLERGST